MNSMLFIIIIALIQSTISSDTWNNVDQGYTCIDDEDCNNEGYSDVCCGSYYYDYDYISDYAYSYYSIIIGAKNDPYYSKYCVSNENLLLISYYFDDYYRYKKTIYKDCGENEDDEDSLLEEVEEILFYYGQNIFWIVLSLLIFIIIVIFIVCCLCCKCCLCYKCQICKQNKQQIGQNSSDNNIANSNIQFQPVELQNQNILSYKYSQNNASNYYLSQMKQSQVVPLQNQHLYNQLPIQQQNNSQNIQNEPVQISFQQEQNIQPNNLQNQLQSPTYQYQNQHISQQQQFQLSPIQQNQNPPYAQQINLQDQNLRTSWDQNQTTYQSILPSIQQQQNIPINKFQNPQYQVQNNVLINQPQQQPIPSNIQKLPPPPTIKNVYPLKIVVINSKGKIDMQTQTYWDEDPIQIEDKQ